MKCPVEHTCSKINKAIDKVKSLGIAPEDKKHLLDTFEYLRESNASLRKWGYTMYNEINGVD